MIKKNKQVLILSGNRKDERVHGGSAWDRAIGRVDEKLGGEREAMLILANEILVMEILVDVISLESTFKIGNVCNVNLEDSNSDDSDKKRIIMRAIS